MKAKTKKPTIILVDDHLIFRQGLKSLITVETLGKVIGEASDGKVFLDLLSETVPDLVLMDIDMPQMDGMEATQKALQILPELKIIVFNKHDFLWAEEQAKKVNSNCHLYPKYLG